MDLKRREKTNVLHLKLSEVPLCLGQAEVSFDSSQDQVTITHIPALTLGERGR